MVILEAAPAGWHPTVPVIGHFVRNHKVGLVFEIVVSKGKGSI